MDFRASVLAGEKDNYLIKGIGYEPQHPLLGALDSLEEAFTTADLQSEDANWILANAQSPINVDLANLWNFINYAYHFRGPVFNVVTNLTMLTGTPNITFESDAEARQWENLSSDQNFPSRWQRIILNTFLFNDYFTLVYDAGTSTPRVRQLEPFHIEKVITEAGDPEAVVGYKRAASDTVHEVDMVVHHRLDYIGNAKRGVPMFSRVLRELIYCYKWLQDIYYLGHMRARLPVVRKVKGGSAQVSSEATRVGQYLPGPGRVVVENQGGEWQYPPAFSGITDAKEGWECFIMAIASAFNLPYFLVASDYRNNSLASTLSADSPTVRLIRWYRVLFDGQFKRIIRLVSGDSVQPEVQWPPVIDRDKEAAAKAYAILSREGAISRESMYQGVEGGDWEAEKARIDAEAAEDDHRWGMGTPEKSKPPGAGGGA